jgi:hypothetical protein
MCHAYLVGIIRDRSGAKTLLVRSKARFRQASPFSVDIHVAADVITLEAYIKKA